MECLLFKKQNWDYDFSEPLFTIPVNIFLKFSLELLGAYLSWYCFSHSCNSLLEILCIMWLPSIDAFFYCPLLQEKTEKSTPNDEYENFVNAHLEAEAKYIPTKLKTKYRVPWETLAVREKRALVKTASKNYRKNPTNTNALKLKTAQYQLAGVYIKEQTEYIQNQIDKIRDSVEDRQSRIAWQTINEVSRRKNTAKAKLKAANQQEKIKLWKQHFENLLGNPPKITHEPITRIISKQLDIKLGPFKQEELDSVLRKIKNRKAAGLDEIPPEVWKTRQFDDILLRHCNAVYNQNPIDRWMKGCILPFPKKGDLGLAKNYRGITLTSIAAKIYNALLRNRIEPKNRQHT